MTYSKRPFESVQEMVKGFGFLDTPLNQVILDYRVDLLKEEVHETERAVIDKDPEMIVDGHIDAVVVALGSLAIMRVNVERAFDEVMSANMRKVLGSRSLTDPSGMSIMKPEGWRPPRHTGNTGSLYGVFD